MTITTADEAWRALRKTSEFCPPHLFPVEGRLYQFFEVAVTYVIAKKHGTLRWKATPVENDNGLDFRGDLIFFDDGNDADGASIVIGGQCKVVDRAMEAISTLNKLTERFYFDLGRIASRHNASVLIACIGARVTQEIRLEARAEFNVAFRRPIEVLTLDELQILFRRHKAEIQGLMFSFGYDRDDISSIIRFITTEDGDYTKLLSITPIAPERTNCGDVFEVMVHVDGAQSIINDSTISYFPPTGAKSRISLINKAAVEQRTFGQLMAYPGMPLAMLRFVNYMPGRVDLGTVKVMHGDTVFADAPLGTVSAADTFTPPFFTDAKGIRSALTRIEQIAKEASDGSLQMIAVIGRGGNGKSRLCQEAALRAEFLGFNTLSLRHPRHLKAPYQILGELIEALVPTGRRENADDVSEILQFIRTFNAHLAEASAQTVAFLVGQGAGDQPLTSAAGKVFDASLCARVLAFLIGLTAKGSPLLLHLSDLHWASPEVFNVLRQTRRIVAGVRNRRGIVIILEGRDKEALSTDPTLGSAPTSAIFEDFAAEMGHQAIAVVPMMPEETRRFVDFLFAERRTMDSPLDPHTLRRERELKDHICRKAAGNPMHIVEVIRHLKEIGLIDVNRLSNRIFFRDRLDQPFDIPKNVSGAIVARFQFLERNNPPVANLLAALAAHTDRCDLVTFDRLRERFAPEVDDAVIECTEFVTLKGEAAFRHELYFEAISSNAALRSDELAAALDIHLNARHLSGWSVDPVAALEMGGLLRGHPHRAFEAKRVLVTAAEAAARQKLSMVQKQALELLIADEPIAPSHRITDQHLSDFLEQVKMRVVYAGLNLWHGDRFRSVDMLTALCNAFETVPIINLPLRLEEFKAQYVSTLIEYSNACLNQFTGHLAVDALNRALLEIGTWTAGADGPVAAMRWKVLQERALNRLGVAYKIEGDPDRARQCHTQALQRYDATPDLEAPFIFHLDRGRAEALLDPRVGLGFLEAATAVTDPSEPEDKRRSIAQAAILTTMLSAFNRGIAIPGINETAEIGRRAEAVYFLALRAGFMLEAAAASLVCGVARAITPDGEESALQWLEECRDLSFRNNYMELLWKVHVNLAQLAARSNGGYERAQENLQSALTLIVDRDLRRRCAGRRETRQAYYRLALFQLWTLAERLGDRDAVAKARSFLPDRADLSMSRLTARRLLEFISLGVNDLFLF